MIEKLPMPKPGIYENLSAEQYHRIDAISSTAVKKFATSPRHEYIRANRPSDPTPAMMLGSAVHTAALEPDQLMKRFLISTVCQGRFKNGSACTFSGVNRCGGLWYCKRHTPGPADPLPQVIAEDEENDVLTTGTISDEAMEKAKIMADRIRTHRDARALLDAPGRQVELSAFWYETITVDGIPEDVACKLRLDIYDGARDFPPVVADIKVCLSSFRPDFESTIAKYRYDLQCSWYLRGMMTATGGVEHRLFDFIAIENTPTHLPGVFRVHPQDIDFSTGEIFEQEWGILANMIRCRRANRWPGYANHNRTLVVHLPEWFHRDRKREATRDDRLPV